MPVETMRPPTTARARGTMVSFPSPYPNAKGSSPRMVASAVITIGLIRRRPASVTAISGVAPYRAMRFAKSTRRILFETTMPIIISVPIIDSTLADVLVR